MRLPHVRFTVRRMMVAIAVLAIVLGCTIEAIRAKRRRDVFLNMARAHAQDEQFNLAMVRSARSGPEECHGWISPTDRRPPVPPAWTYGDGRLERVI